MVLLASHYLEQFVRIASRNKFLFILKCNKI